MTMRRSFEKGASALPDRGRIEYPDRVLDNINRAGPSGGFLAGELLRPPPTAEHGEIDC